MNRSYTRRCESALIHPATVTALVVLLLNDVVFKSMWPDAWLMGKLSDLAWVVFASPLLAFLLSFLVGGNAVGQRSAFLASYLGLPLLYAAFNTFEPIHIWILRGLSIASGGTAGSPLDATDSLVIPLGLGVAVWVWRRGVASAERLRLRWGLLMAGVAAFASVATSYPEPELGVRDVGSSADGTVYASSDATMWRRPHRSDDGGLRWTAGSIDPGEEIVWGGESTKTPRGTYVIQGPNVMLLSPDGGSQLVYSTAYLQGDANLWVQEYAPTELDDRYLTTSPYSIVYDGHSDNLIVAMGTQGVVTGTPDGRWSRVAVGRYAPTDFSFSGKTRLMLFDSVFWATALALTLSITAIALILARYRRRDLPLGVAVALAILLVLVGGPSILISIVAWLLIGYSSLGILLLIVAAFVVSNMPEESRVWRSLALAICVPSLIGSGALLFFFGASELESSLYIGLIQLASAMAAFAFVFPALVSSRRLIAAYWPAVIAAVVGMNMLVALAFLLWLHLGIPLLLAKGAAVVLVMLVALVLVKYVRWPRQQGYTGVVLRSHRRR